MTKESVVDELCGRKMKGERRETDEEGRRKYLRGGRGG